MSSARGGWMLALWLAACGAREPVPCAPQPGVPPPPAASRVVPLPETEGPALDISIRPAPPMVHVEIRARDGGASWGMSGTSMSGLQASDDAGELPTMRLLPAGSTPVSFQRAPRGSVRVRYTLPAPDTRRFVADGATLLLLPAIERPVSTRITLDPIAFGAGARAASSFGFGREVRVDASAEALSRATFVAGVIGQAELDGPEGLDRAAWSGTTAFDPRQVAAEVAGFRSGAREYFAAREQRPLMLLMIADARLAGEFAATRRTASVRVDVGSTQPWTGALRLAAAQQVLREWIGAELAVAPVARNHSFESAWLADGVNRAVARELLFRFGLLTPEEYRDEVEQLIALHVTSPVLRVPMHALASHADRASAEAAVVVRGALYATLLDALIREKSKNAFGLDDLLRELFTAARAKSGPLPPEAITEAVGNFLGADRALEIESRYLRGDSTIVLPSGALGRCFRPRPASYPVFALGFSPEGHASADRRATSVDPKGPAARAGIRNGDWIRGLRYLPDRTDAKVVLEVQRGTEWKRLSYLPLGTPVPGQGFARVPGIRDEDCALRR